MQKHELADFLWFNIVVDLQSFSAAADKLGASKSVVSKHITRLEQSLGVQLLRRTTRQLNLTDAGKQVYQRVSHIAEELEHVKQLAYSHHEIPQGKLRINAPFGFGHQHLVTAAADFMKQYPQIQIELVLGSYLADMIHEGIDLAINLKPSKKDNIIQKKIASYNIHVCATKNYLKKFGTPRTPEDLLEHNCLLYKSPHKTREWYFLDKTGKEFGVNVSGNFSANSSQALLSAALNDLGIVKLSSHQVMDAMRDGKLISILKNYCQKDIGIYIIRTKTSYLPKKTRLFIDFLAKRFS